MGFEHQTVLLNEATSLLQPAEGKLIVDATLGGGGHAEALLEGGATVVGLDRDDHALAAARARLSRFPNFRAVKGNFGELERIVEREGLGELDGVLADIGVSSPQFDVPERGFSFSKEGPLDMRMGQEGPTAAELIEQAEPKELARVLREFGEEPFSGPIARALKAASPKTTTEAVEAVKGAVPRKAWPQKIHVATRTFQALRIWVNDELGALERLLGSLPRVLKVGGRAAIISFHSLEDRRVKDAFRALEGRCTCPPGLPICACGAKGSFEVLTKKAITASEGELDANPRSRSAKLRGVEKVR